MNDIIVLAVASRSPNLIIPNFMHYNHSAKREYEKVRYSRKNIGIISIAPKMCCVLS